MRVNVDFANENYPIINNESNGYDLNSYKTDDVIIRSNNPNIVQLDLIFKAGSTWKWYKPNTPTPYIDIPGMTTQMI